MSNSRFSAKDNSKTHDIFEVYASGTNEGTTFRSSTSGTTMMTMDSKNEQITASVPMNASAVVTVSNATASTSTTTGALIVTGGTAIGGRLYSGAGITISDTSEAVSNTSASLVTQGGASINKDLRVVGTVMTLGGIDANTQRIRNVPLPVSATDAVSKQYVDNVAAGLDAKMSVAVATTGPVTLADLVPSFVVDGFTLVTSSRVLVKDQVSPVENGIYLINATGPPTRTTDFAVGASVAGSYFFVESGSQNAKTGFVVINPTGSDIVGTDAISFSPFTGAADIIAGDGLTKAGNRLDISVDSNHLEVVADKVRIATAAAGTGLIGGGNDALAVSSNLSHVTQVGTLTTGTWNASTVQVPYGGTGVTSHLSGGVLVGNGSNAIQSSTALTFASDTLTAPTIVAGRQLQVTSQSETISGPSTLSGTFIRLPDKLYTDNVTPATTSVSGSNAVFFGTPTFAAENAGVNYTKASTVTIGGAPIAGTNMTLLDSTALRVQSGSVKIEETLDSTLSLAGGALVVSGGASIGKRLWVSQSVTADTFSGRYLSGPATENAIYLGTNYAGTTGTTAVYANSAFEVYTGGLINAQMSRMTVSSTGRVTITNPDASVGVASGALDVAGGIYAGNNSVFGGTLSVAGNATMGGTLSVTGGVVFSSSLSLLNVPTGVRVAVSSNANAPIISRTRNTFSTGPYTGAGRWGLFAESAALTLGLPAGESNKWTFSTYNTDSTIASEWVSINASSGQVLVNSTTNVTGANTGALVINGGQYIEKNLWVNDSVYVANDILVGTVGSITDDSITNLKLSASTGNLILSSVSGSILLESSQQVIFSQGLQLPTLDLGKTSGTINVTSISHGVILDTDPTTTLSVAASGTHMSIYAMRSLVVDSATAQTLARASTFYLQGAPQVGSSNLTVTDLYSMYVSSGRIHFGDTNESSVITMGGMRVSKTLSTNALMVDASNTNSIQLGTVKVLRLPDPLNAGEYENHIQSANTTHTTFNNLVFSDPNTNSAIATIKATGMTLHGTTSGSLTTFGGITAAGNVSASSMTLTPTGQTRIGLTNTGAIQNLSNGALQFRVMSVPDLISPVSDDPTVYTHRHIVNTTVSTIDSTTPVWPLNDGTASTIDSAYTTVYTGYLIPTYSETFTFYLTLQNCAAKLIVDHEAIITNYTSNASQTTYNGTFTFSSSTVHVPIILLVQCVGTPNTVRLEWSSVSQLRQVIPSTQFAFSGHENAPVTHGPLVVGSDALFTDKVTFADNVTFNGSASIGSNVEVDSLTVKDYTFTATQLPIESLSETLFMIRGPATDPLGALPLVNTNLSIAPPTGTVASNPSAYFRVFSNTGPINTAHLSIGYEATNSKYVIKSKKSGAGVLHPILLGDSLEVSPSGTISIANTTDADMATGSLALAGGVHVAKSIVSLGSLSSSDITSTTGAIMIGTASNATHDTGLSRALFKDTTTLVLNYQADFTSTRIDSPVTINNTTVSSLTLLGGMSVQKSATISGPLFLDTNAQIIGGTTSVPVSISSVTDMGLYNVSAPSKVIRFMTDNGSVTFYSSSGSSPDVTIGASSITSTLPLSITNNSSTSIQTTGGISASGQLSIGTNATVTGTTTTSIQIVTDTTDSTSMSSLSALQVAGGATVQKNIYAGGKVSANQTVEVRGTSPLVQITGASSGLPTQDTRSVGTRVLLSDTVSATTLDTAIGTASSGMWVSLEDSTKSFNVYAGSQTTNPLTITGDGNVIFRTASSSQIAEYRGYSSIDVVPFTDNTAVSLNMYQTANKTGTPWSTGVNALGAYTISYTTPHFEITQSGTAKVLSTTDTTSISTGALTVAGGMTVAKTLGVYGNQTISGTLSVDTINMNSSSVLLYSSGVTRLRSASAGGIAINDLASGSVSIDSSSDIVHKVNSENIATISSTGLSITRGLSMTSNNAVMSTLSTVDDSISTAGGIIANRISTAGQIRAATRFALAPSTGAVDATIGVTSGNILSITSPNEILLTGNTSVNGSLTTSSTTTASSLVASVGLKVGTQPFQVYSLQNTDATDKQWYYIGTVNTTPSSTGLTEKGAISLRIVNSTANKTSTLYWSAQVNNASGPTLVASHWYSAHSSITAGTAARVVVYNSGSDDYHLFIQLQPLSNVQVIIDHSTNLNLQFPAVSEGTSTEPSGATSGFSNVSYTTAYNTDSASGTSYMALGTLAITNSLTTSSMTVTNTLITGASIIVPVVNSTTGGSLALQVNSSTVALLQSNSLTLSGALLPSSNNVYDIGSSTGPRFKDLYLSGNSVVGGQLSCSTLSTTSSATIGGALTLGATIITDGLRNTTPDATSVTIAPPALVHIKGLLETSRGLIISPTGTSRVPDSTSGHFLEVSSGVFNDTTTSASSSAPNFASVYVGAPIVAASNSAVVTPIARTLYIAGAPSAGTNQTITNAYAVEIASGRVLIGSTLDNSLTSMGGITVSKDVSLRNVTFNNVNALGDVATIGTTTTSSRTTIVARVGSDTSSGTNSGFSIVHASLTNGDLTMASFVRDVVTIAPKLQVTDTTDSSALGAGSIITAGGASIEKNVRVGGTIFADNVQSASNTLTLSNGTAQVLSVVGGNQLIVNPNASLANGTVVQSTLSVSVNTASTSATSGALTVSGGLGVVGRINTTGALFVQRSSTAPLDMASVATFAADGPTISVDTLITGSNRQLLVEGTVNDATIGLRANQRYTWDMHVAGSNGALNITSGDQNSTSAFTALSIANGSGVVQVRSTIESADTSTGALQVAGGLAVTKSLNVGKAITLTRSINGGATMTVANPNTGTSAWAQYSLQNDTGNVASLVFNSSGRATEGGSSALSLINTTGSIRLATASGAIMTATDTQVLFDRTPVSVASTVEASNTSTGSLVVSGGLAVAKKIQASGQGIVLNASTSGAVTLKSANTTDTFTLTVPIGLPPVANASLIADLSGNLTWGTPLAAAGNTSGKIISTFRGVNNQTTPVSINGLSYSGGSFVLFIRVEVDATTRLVGSYELRGVYDGTTWSMIINSFRDDTLVNFSITSSGQIQYTSGAYAGFNDLIFSWEDTITNSSIVNRLVLGDNLSADIDPNTGVALTTKAGLTFIDTATTAAGTRTNFDIALFNPQTLEASSSNVTTTNASTLTIAGAPIVGANQTVTNLAALRIMSGVTRLQETVDSSSTTTGALIISGGTAIAKSLHVGGQVHANNGVRTGSSGTLISKKLVGNVAIGANASQSITVAVTFVSAMSSTSYTITGNVATTSTSSNVYVVSFSELTTTGCTATIYLINGSSWADTNVRLGYIVQE